MFIYQFDLFLNIIYDFTVKSSQILKCCLLVSDIDHTAKVFLEFYTDQIALFVKKGQKKGHQNLSLLAKLLIFFLVWIIKIAEQNGFHWIYWLKTSNHPLSPAFFLLLTDIWHGKCKLGIFIKAVSIQNYPIAMMATAGKHKNKELQHLCYSHFFLWRRCFAQVLNVMPKYTLILTCCTLKPIINSTHLYAGFFLTLAILWDVCIWGSNPSKLLDTLNYKWSQRAAGAQLLAGLCTQWAIALIMLHCNISSVWNIILMMH